MTEAAETQGRRIRALFANAVDEVSVIAPFIKVDALKSLLEVIPPALRFRCVTRWLPREVAVGVSDPEILELLDERGNFTLCLVDRLHAKLYIAGTRCLAGSANVTLPGLGAVNERNIEVLVETTIDDPGIAPTLEEISLFERPATSQMAQAVRRSANILAASITSAVDIAIPWFPISRRPEYAYEFYRQPSRDSVKTADRILLKDLAYSNLQPGLDEKGFRTAVRSLLSDIPMCKQLIDSKEDMRITRADAQSYLEEYSGEDISTRDLWLAFVNWVVYFFSDEVIKQEISEFALRRAQPL